MNKYFILFRNFFTKDFEEISNEKLRTLTLLITFCAVALIVFPMFLLTHYLMNDLQGAVVLFFISISFGSCLILLKLTKNTAVVGNLGTFLFFILTTYFGYFQGGFDSTSLIPKIATPVIAYILVGRKSAILWLFFEIASITSFYILSNSGYIFPISINEEWIEFDRFLQLVASLITLFILFMYSETSRIKALNELIKERERSESLLYNTLPKHIAIRLKDDKKQIAEYFPSCTVLFADLVGFTAMSSNKAPAEIVKMLDLIFSRFDELTSKNSVEKIKTIGDCYMAAVGIQEPQRLEITNHSSIVELGFAMIEEIKSINKQYSYNLQIRIGISSGEVVAGVIGFEKLAYDLWGDTVNTASRMESHGIPGLIHCSENTYEILKNHYSFVKSDSIDIKGKGKINTYFISVNNKFY